MRKEIKPMQYLFYYYPALIISLSGLVNSIYLSFSHYRNYADIMYISFCAISKSINCDTVSQSRYSIFLDIPVPVWGVIGYALLLYIVTVAGGQTAQKKRGWATVFFISGAFSFYSMILAFISGYYIKSYCIMCILSYAVNLLMLLYSWIIRNRFDNDGLFYALKKDIQFFISKANSWFFIIIISLAPVLLWALLPHYWELKPLSIEESELSSGVTEDGHPWIGAEKPEMTITEFSDYRCFQCKKAHFFLRQLVSNYPDKLRLVHRHYPMDSRFNSVVVQHPFHEGAGELALIAIYAAYKGDFWRINDILFNMETGDSGIVIMADKMTGLTGLSKEELFFALKNEAIRNILKIDLIEGMKLELTGTPAFLINGKVYIGELPVDLINKALNN